MVERQKASYVPRDGTLPWTRSCFVCGESNPRGLQLKSRLEDGMVVLEYTARETDVGWQHIVHGGLTMTLMDEVMTWASMIAAGRACVAAEITSRLKQPVQVGTPLRVEGKSVARRSRLIIAEATVLGLDGQVLASAEGKYLPMPEGDARLCGEDFVTDTETIDPHVLMGEGVDHGKEKEPLA